MRVTWVIVTLGLLWTAHADDISPAPPTIKAPTDTTPKIETTSAVTTKPTPVATDPTTATTVTTKLATEIIDSSTAPTTAAVKPSATAAAPSASAAPSATATKPTPSITTSKLPPTITVAPENTSAKTGTSASSVPPGVLLPSTIPSEIKASTSPSGATDAGGNTESKTTDKPGGATTVAGAGAGPGPGAGSLGTTSPTQNPSATSASSDSILPKTTVKPHEESTSGSVQITTQSPAATTTVLTTTTVKTTILPTTPGPTVTFTYEYKKDENETILTKVCTKLLQLITNGSCSMKGRKLHNGQHVFDTVSINGNVNTSVVDQHYKELRETEKKTGEEKVNEKGAEDSDSTTLIAILASCGAVALIIVGLAIYTYRHGKSYRKNQQHLTEELQTVENGYHDNPTLEVEAPQETAMEKRPNGEFNDSWIVPIDNLLKEELPDEEDTHL